MRRFLFGLVGLLVFSPIACAGSPQKSFPPFQRLVADLGPGCRFAVTLLGRKGVVSPQDSSRTEVGGDPKVGKGGMVEAPYPKPWKGIMNSLGFSIQCYGKNDSGRPITLAWNNPQSDHWVKNKEQMKQLLLESEAYQSDEELLRETIRTTNIFDIRTVNSHGWAETYVDQIGDEELRQRHMRFCLMHESKALCGNGAIGYLSNGPKGDLTKYALDMLRSIEFLDSAAPTTVN